MNSHTHREAVLALADGTIFRGTAIGADGSSVGEVVFNTALTGYQEILTDPSYARQIVTLTYPHIGNTGVNKEDEESDQIWAAGTFIKPLFVGAVAGIGATYLLGNEPIPALGGNWSPRDAHRWRCRRRLDRERPDPQLRAEDDSRDQRKIQCGLWAGPRARAHRRFDVRHHGSGHG